MDGTISNCVAILALALGGCGTTPVRAPRIAAIDAARAPSVPAHLPITCDVVRPSESTIVGGVLRRDLVMQMHDESAVHVVLAVCACAREHGVYAPGVLRVRAILVPGRGAIGGADPSTEGGARDSDDWPAFRTCLAQTLASVTIPVHVIGSDSLPDPDPSDERVMMPIRVELR